MNSALVSRLLLDDRLTALEMQVPFDFAQGRLSAPLKSAPLRMTGLLFIQDLRAN